MQFLNNSVYCQKLMQSEPVDINNELDYTIIGQFNNSILLFRETESTYIIQSFNDSLKEEWEKNIEFEIKDITPLKIIPQKEYFLIVYYYHKKGNCYVRSKKVNTKGVEKDDVEIGKFDSPCYPGNHQLKISKDNSYLLIYNVKDDNHIETISLNLNNNEKSNNQIIEFTDLKYYRNFEQILINNSGEIFTLFNKNNNKRKREQHYFSIIKIESNGKQSIQNVPFYDYLSGDMKIEYDDLNNKIVAAGFYINEKKEANGIFYFTSNLSEVVHVKTIELEESFMRNLTGKKRKNMDGISDFFITNLILRRDGGVLLVAEQQFVFQASGFGSEDDNTETLADYLYENIFLASIHPSGELFWKEVLYKSQSSENDNGKSSSFFIFRTNSNLRFLYNDNISRSTSIFEYVVSNKGVSSRNVIVHQQKRTGFLPQFRSSLQLSSKEMIVLSEREDRLRLIKIKY